MRGKYFGICVAVSVALAGFLVIEANKPARSATLFDASVLETNDGQQIFEQVCQGCHMPAGVGAIGAGHYPALANNAAIHSKQYMALTVITGRRNMPAFGAKHAVGMAGAPATLSDVQIAAVINYVRTHFGNHYADAITPAEVGALDKNLH